MESEKLLKKGASRLGVALDQQQVEALLLYFGELKKWNRRINLIARDTKDEQILENHFLDSLTLYPLLVNKEGIRLLDVGTGAGFPGLVLAAVLPKVSFTLLEPRLKRVSFLRHIARILQLTNVEIVADRIEAFAHEHIDHFNLVTSRAVASPVSFLPMVYPILEQGATAVIMAAKEERLLEVENMDRSCRLISTQRFVLPYSGADRIVGLVRLH
ncbi:16S rRNA (guanine(527)-N(7))-methyltransferase RsmG [Desulfogranum marinum]|uniref:16S rRNA (guanine(527)-N(7))-methyltransferase RsmG n=1 Tax=Desulfogranum marinum TaxID=453220 RepID=UPI0029C8A797|nr:16S rRNA (guanine(527)-N(7))-methyltransferase RsmG [Desulfogranum marinum]